ncbi:MAG: efflux transporter outer membrane subunit [Magnetococcales bacterium]|nr:efflux transporter outer membrane subunit [Magnetococcales bacterium]
MGLTIFIKRFLPPLIQQLVLLALLAGCSAVGPDYQPDAALPTASQWQAPLPHAGSTAKLTDWWAQFQEPTLLTLQEAAATTHPNLQRALAAIQEARAAVVSRQSDGRPKADGSASAMRLGDHSNTTPESTAYTVEVDAQWELDLFGGVRRATEAATARLAGRENSWHDARVTLAAEVASKYLQERACRQLQDLSLQDLNSRRESARLTALAVTAGLTAPVDLNQARAREAESSSALLAQQALCEGIVKSLVTLTGLAEPELRSLLGAAKAAIPTPAAFVVESLPADLLAQRPDLAALERELAAASADIGLAEANRYPRLMLLGSLSLSSLQTASRTLNSQPWSLGPALLLPLLDGGGRSARVEEARARFSQAQARLMAAIRAAVEEVELALVNLESSRHRRTEAHASSQEYAANLHSLEKHWRAGGISLLVLADGQRGLTHARRNEIVLQRDHVQAWITLYKALGGGWHPTPPADHKGA